MDTKTLKIYRSIDKWDKGPLVVFNLLTKGNKDKSGDFTEGAGLTAGQAIGLIQFLISIPRNDHESLIKNRLELMGFLEDSLCEDGQTVWEKLITLPTNADNTWTVEGDVIRRPENIGWTLDDLVGILRKHVKEETPTN